MAGRTPLPPERIGPDWQEMMQRIEHLFASELDLHPKTKSFLRSLYRRLRLHQSQTIVPTNQRRVLVGIEKRLEAASPFTRAGVTSQAPI